MSFDGTGAKNTCRTIQLYDADKIFFRNEALDTAKTTFVSYTQGHYLSEYIQNNTLELTESSGVYTSTKTFTGSEIKGVHVTVLLSTNITVGFDLLPYNSQEFVFYGLESNTPTFITAKIDSTGAVVITPTSATITSATYYLR